MPSTPELILWQTATSATPLLLAGYGELAAQRGGFARGNRAVALRAVDGKAQLADILANGSVAARRHPAARPRARAVMPATGRRRRGLGQCGHGKAHGGGNQRCENELFHRLYSLVPTAAAPWPGAVLMPCLASYA